MFDISKYSNNLHAPERSQILYTSNPSGIEVPSGTYVSTGYPILGRHRRSSFNKSFDYIPGKHIQLGGIEHQSYNGDCSNSPKTITYGTYMGKRVKMRQVWGQLAAFLYTPTTSLHTIPDLGAKRSIVLVSALSKAHELEAECGTMLAEAGETLSMLASPFRSLPKLMKKLQRPNIFMRSQASRFSSAFEYASSAWLQYRYGILPLVSDIDTIRGLTREKLTREYPFTRKKASLRVDETSVLTARKAFLIGNSYYWGSVLVRTWGQARALVFFRKRFAGLNNELGLDGFRLPVILWETVPYSFVVDWFVNVGDWIQAVTPVPGVSHLAHCTSEASYEEFTAELSLVGQSSVPSASYPLTAISGRFSGKAIAYRRYVNEPVPVHPQVNVSLSNWKRKLDGISLLWNQVPKPPRR